MKRKACLMIAATLAAVLLVLLLGPLDVFTHGYYSDAIPVKTVAKEDRLGSFSVDDPACVLTFTPCKPHFAGFQIYLPVHDPSAGGVLTAHIADAAGREVEAVSVSLDKVRKGSWYKVFTEKELKEGERYTLSFEVSGTDAVPSFLRVNPDYLSDEVLSGDVFLFFAYARSTFSLAEKALLSLGIAALWLLALARLSENEGFRRAGQTACTALVLVVLLAWNYMFGSMDIQNKESFSTFQADSETLVTSVILAERDGISVREADKSGFGLGRYLDLKGELKSYDRAYRSDAPWSEGYHQSKPQIAVRASELTDEIAAVGNYVRFQNGEEYAITELSADGDELILTLDASRALNRAKNGSLDELRFFDAEHREFDSSSISAYESQYGLQGKIFRHLARCFEDFRTALCLLTALAMAAMAVLIVWLISRKYDRLYAVLFYLTFLLSPWIVNFARNLYWVEFIWFAPTAVGLICAIKGESRTWRLGCCAAAYVTILVKCLCGYEYLSCIMMGLIVFVVSDMFLALAERDRPRAKRLFLTTLGLGVAALAGFVTAICIHASLRGGGSLGEGIRKIIQLDVLRRTSGANPNDFDSRLWPSFNASVWEVFCMYFRMPTDIVTGVGGRLFPLLCLAPAAIFVFDGKKADRRALTLYVLFFLSAVSWLCLAKSHSYIHKHISYVVWYFGFVQTCFYVIAKKAKSLFAGKAAERESAL